MNNEDFFFFDDSFQTNVRSIKNSDNTILRHSEDLVKELLNPYVLKYHYDKILVSELKNYKEQFYIIGDTAYFMSEDHWTKLYLEFIKAPIKRKLSSKIFKQISKDNFINTNYNFNLISEALIKDFDKVFGPTHLNIYDKLKENKGILSQIISKTLETAIFENIIGDKNHFNVNTYECKIKAKQLATTMGANLSYFFIRCGFSKDIIDNFRTQFNKSLLALSEEKDLKSFFKKIDTSITNEIRRFVTSNQDFYRWMLFLT